MNREIGRRSDVVGIFPNVAAALRLMGAVLQEQHEEWLAFRRDFSSEAMAKLQPPAKGGETAPQQAPADARP